MCQAEARRTVAPAAAPAAAGRGRDRARARGAESATVSLVTERRGGGEASPSSDRARWWAENRLLPGRQTRPSPARELPDEVTLDVGSRRRRTHPAPPGGGASGHAPAQLGGGRSSLGGRHVLDRDLPARAFVAGRSAGRRPERLAEGRRHGGTWGPRDAPRWNRQKEGRCRRHLHLDLAERPGNDVATPARRGRAASLAGGAGLAVTLRGLWPRRVGVRPMSPLARARSTSAISMAPRPSATPASGAVPSAFGERWSLEGPERAVTRRRTTPPACRAGRTEGLRAAALRACPGSTEQPAATAQ